jgi:hypothetical protein
MKRIDANRLNSLAIMTKKKLGPDYLCFANFNGTDKTYSFVIYKKTDSGKDVIFKTKEGMTAKECYHLIYGWYSALSFFKK